MTGKFYGIGVGPGAVDLLTVRAANILKTVDVLCIPRSSAEKSSVALTVAKSYIGLAEIIEIATPMTRDAAILDASWQTGAEAIAERLQQGQNVAFITIGDSMLYSTYTYLMKKLQALVPEVEIVSVPGITSYSASAAHLNLPLAEGNEKLVVIPALDDPQDLKAILRLFPNVILMKVASNLPAMVEVLAELGLLDKAIYISKLGYPDQFITRDLRSLQQKKLDYLSLIIVKQGGF
jgi:precorrin-2/cobalt-factor-2 C20-methyltransferase